MLAYNLLLQLCVYEISTSIHTYMRMFIHIYLTSHLHAYIYKQLLVQTHARIRYTYNSGSNGPLRSRARQPTAASRPLCRDRGQIIRPVASLEVTYDPHVESPLPFIAFQIGIITTDIINIINIANYKKTIWTLSL